MCYTCCGIVCAAHMCAVLWSAVLHAMLCAAQPLQPLYLIRKECTQYLLDCSMLEFNLSIALWMVSSRMKYFCTQEFPKWFPELFHKTSVFATYNWLRNSEISHNMCKEQLCYLSCSYYLIMHLTRNENCVFCEVIQTSENCVTSMRVG